MALIICKECSRQISNTLNSCPFCGNILRNSASVGNTIRYNESFGNIAFEKRIDEYKSNGYNLVKREGENVQLIEPISKKYRIFILLIVISIPVIVYIFLFICYAEFGGSLIRVYATPLLALIAIYVNIKSISDTKKVNISITKIGKIEETGNILKK